VKPRVNIFWFRRDLRLEDNAGLFHALKSGIPVIPLFIFDRDILDELDDRKDRRVEFIYQQILRLRATLASMGIAMEIKHGFPQAIFKEFQEKYIIETVFTNSDYEPYATHRDEKVKNILSASGTGFRCFKDQVIFEKKEVVKENGEPYTVFTPYSKRWKALLNEFVVSSYPIGKYEGNFYHQELLPIPSLGEMGFEEGGIPFPANNFDTNLFADYKEKRDFPSIQGTSRLGVHLRFGTISIRQLVRAAKNHETFLNELIWREFYQAILWHFPQVVIQAFKPVYNNIPWRNHPAEFEAWCKGETGYPIVDAGMRELNATGFMHNRVRMITASFLTKHLLVDWRWGEAWFAKKLLDYELASNNGGWQWAAGSGCDAAPYFRIFNPYIQAKKFDPLNKYIRQWVPDFDKDSYPVPIVAHETARARCLQVYAEALKK
jgi:deoxyribodipyrimidine photo-lyase